MPPSKRSEAVKWVNEQKMFTRVSNKTLVDEKDIHKGSEWSVLNASVVVAGMHMGPPCVCYHNFPPKISIREA